MMPWAALDDEFHSHPKILQVGNAGAGLFARALSYCAAHLTDGFVPDGFVRQATEGKVALARKVEEGHLWRRVEGGYEIPDYLQFNPSREQVAAKRSEISQKRSIAGRKGAEARWGHSNPHNNQSGKSDSKPDGNGDGIEMPPSPSPSPRGSRVSSGQTAETEFSPLPATDELDPADPIDRLLACIRDPDQGTERVLRSFVGKVPEAAFEIAREEVRTHNGGAGLAVTILKRIRDTGILVDTPPETTEKEQSQRPLFDVARDLIERFATEYPDDALLDELGILERKREEQLTDDQRTMLLELAAERRTQTAAA